MNAQKKFLIVDDYLTMRLIIRGLLQEIGFRNSHEAEDGAIALQMLKTNHFDFVVSDVQMPNMDGFELLHAIKADVTLKHIPVLMATATASEEDNILATRSGAAGYIEKPINLKELKQIIERAVA